MTGANPCGGKNFLVGKTLDEALEQAREAVAFHIEGLLDEGASVPSPRSVEIWAADPNYAGRIWAVVNVDIATLSGRSKRLNISLPERVLRRVDAAAARSGESRSGYLARIALQAG